MIAVFKGVAAMSIGLASLALASGRSVTSVSAASRAGTVTICHFPAHNGDFVTSNIPWLNADCGKRGGNLMTIGIPGCQNGHHAKPANPTAAIIGRSGTCADGDYAQPPT